MKVLMLTQVIDPEADVLGFVPGWIRALGRRVERLYVLAGRVVPCDLGPNVEVMSLGKEEGKGRLTRLARFFLGIKHAVARRGADVIFAHMNPEYVIAAAPVSRAPVVLWYTHTAVTKKLKLAVRLSRLVATATEESFGVKTAKLRPIGHGIDLSQFAVTDPPGGFNVLSVGRLDAIKNMECVLEAAALLRTKYPAIRVTLAGDGPRRGQLEALARERAVRVDFRGKVPFPEIPRLYRDCDAFASASRSALDKAILEAMASGRPVVSCNRAYAGFAPAGLTFPDGDAAGMAGALERVLGGDRAELGRNARMRVEREHGLEGMMDRLVGVLAEASGRER